MKAVKKMLNNSPRTMNGMYDLTHSKDSAREDRQGGPFKEMGDNSRRKHVDAYNAKADWAGESEEVDKRILSKTPNRKMAKSWEKTKHPLIKSTFGPTVDVTRDSDGKVVGVRTTSTSY